MSKLNRPPLKFLTRMVVIIFAVAILLMILITLGIWQLKFSPTVTSALIVTQILTLLLLPIPGIILYKKLIKLVSRINNTNNYFVEVAGGHLQEQLPNDGNDEYGQMIQQAQCFFSWFSNTIDKLVICHRDLSGSAEQLQKAFTLLKNGSSKMFEISDQSIEMTDDVHFNIKELHKAFNETDVGITKISESANNLIMEFEKLEEGLDQINQDIIKIKDVTSLSLTAGEDASKVAGQANQEIKDLLNHAESITNFIKVIKDISEQTNLLALNATIEAASAKEHGKGFAVVASEIKDLSVQSASALEQITLSVEKLQKQAQQSTNTNKMVVESIQKSTELNHDIKAAVENQVRMTSNMFDSMKESLQLSYEINQTSTNIAVAVHKTAAQATSTVTKTDQVAANTQELARAARRNRNYLKKVNESNQDLDKHIIAQNRRFAMFQTK